jgi:hypothetical protein
MKFYQSFQQLLLLLNFLSSLFAGVFVQAFNLPLRGYYNKYLLPTQSRLNSHQNVHNENVGNITFTMKQIPINGITAIMRLAFEEFSKVSYLMIETDQSITLPLILSRILLYLKRSIYKVKS